MAYTIPRDPPMGLGGVFILCPFECRQELPPPAPGLSSLPSGSCKEDPVGFGTGRARTGWYALGQADGQHLTPPEVVGQVSIPALSRSDMEIRPTITIRGPIWASICQLLCPLFVAFEMTDTGLLLFDE